MVGQMSMQSVSDLTSIRPQKLYLMACVIDGVWNQPVKVGQAADPANRLISLRTGCPFPLGIYQTWSLPSREPATFFERMFHQLEAAHRLSGEWFSIGPAVAEQLVDLNLACWLLSQGTTVQWPRFGQIAADDRRMP